MPDRIFWACMAIILAGVLVMAADIGRRRRIRDPQRLFTWSQKHIIRVRAHNQCEHKSVLRHRCRAAGTDADHVIPWSRGGVTQLWNSQLLCRRHNRRKSNRQPSRLYRWRLHHRRAHYDRL